MTTNFNRWIYVNGTFVYNDKPYIAFDGKRFSTETECRAHEAVKINYASLGIKIT